MDDTSILIDIISEIPIAAVLLYAYHRASRSLEDQREFAQRREEMLMELIGHLCHELRSGQRPGTSSAD